VTARRLGGRRMRPHAVPTVGLFGNLGCSNIGNDASMEAVLAYLRASHPDVIIDAMCAGPEIVTDRYGIAAVPLVWHHKHAEAMSGIPAMAVRVLSKGIDVFRTAAWVRRHDAVIVPGMGILEASLPLRPWGFPYALFLLSGSGRLFGTKVALVSVGAGIINQRLTRWLFDWAARLAFYRSYRSTGSRDAMRQRGLDTTGDHVYPDLAFALPAPSFDPGDAQVVCVGVMDYHGSNDDRQHADEIRASYVDGMKRFVRWLVDNGRTVRLIVGDTNGSDDTVVQEILADLRKSRPDLDPSRVVPQPVTSFADVMRAIQPAGSVVAIRFHNVLAALKLSKPTITLSYYQKHDALTAEMGMSRFCQPVNPFDLDLLIRRFTELESNSAQLSQVMIQRNAVNKERLASQFAELSALLLPSTEPVRPAVEYSAREGLW
jgi:polysaccharide pyruvyl transferase WcaK-like protein